MNQYNVLRYAYNEISSADNIITYKYNEISNNATYLHILDNKIITNYNDFL